MSTEALLVGYFAGMTVWAIGGIRWAIGSSLCIGLAILGAVSKSRVLEQYIP